jgi:hypothetical protein
MLRPPELLFLHTSPCYTAILFLALSLYMAVDVFCLGRVEQLELMLG